ncbi:MAG: TonB family protein [Acidobacteriota bacterium]|nr:TonB family protein [Acidobacteriota bacterium]
MSEAWKTWEGQAVDGFPLQQYLGGSDHSAVYLTQLNSSGAQKAAIKFIPADATADAQLARWRVAGELTHAHLLQLVRVGRCQMANASFLYVVMEYAEEDLSQILPQRALEPEETRQIVESVLDALTYLHGQGLAHTRIKPGNIMAAGDQLKISSDTLCEIGGAPLVRQEATIYAAPESTAAPVSIAADVWSLGVTVVETLTQRTPLIRSQTRTEFPVPETIPPPYLEIARRCVQLDPARRASLKEISVLLNPGAAPHREIPMTSPVAEPVAASEPGKKSLASQHVSLAPHTLLGAATSKTTVSQPSPRKSRFALPLFIAIVVLIALLLAPRMLNRFSQLQPHAEAVQPTIAPAAETLTPPAATNAPAAKPGRSKQVISQPNGADTIAVGSGAARPSEKEPAHAKISESLAGTTPTEAGPGRPVDKSSNSMAAKTGGASSTTANLTGGRGAVQYQVVPDISQRAKDSIQGTVKVFVKLQVDAGGAVTHAELISGSNKFFGDQAVNVSRRWTFTPPQANGQNAASEWLLRFEFSRASTKVFPVQTSP